MSDLDAASVAAEFVATYYHVFVYDPASIRHFYSSAAVVYRRAQHSFLAVPIADLRPALLAPQLPSAAALHIAAYSVAALPGDGRLLVSVAGCLELPSSRRSALSQAFVLEERGGRVFVVSDSLLLFNIADTFAANAAAGARSGEGSDDSDDGRLRKSVRRDG
jgi:hypothetical protein